MPLPRPELPTAAPLLVAASRQEPALDLLVVVQRDWNGWMKAMTPLSALEDVHWRQPAGAPRPLIHAYVRCDALVSGMVPHDCGDTGSQHRLLVCVLKKHSLSTAFEELVRRANQAPAVLTAVRSSRASTAAGDR